MNMSISKSTNYFIEAIESSKNSKLMNASFLIVGDAQGVQLLRCYPIENPVATDTPPVLQGLHSQHTNEKFIFSTTRA